ncbi:hypothetical protein EV360DRAFT_9257, partial [Lentinula raphanica]
RFRYIDCQVQSLKKYANARRVLQALQQLPKDLQDIYTEAIQKSQKSLHSEDAHHILLWLLYSFEPLYLSQVAAILSIDLNLLSVEAETEILIELGEIVDTTLVTMNEEKIVQLAHSSVKEFLLQSQANIHTKYVLNVNANLAHNVIAQMCLIYLLQWKYTETI